MENNLFLSIGKFVAESSSLMFWGEEKLPQRKTRE